MSPDCTPCSNMRPNYPDRAAAKSAQAACAGCCLGLLFLLVIFCLSVRGSMRLYAALHPDPVYPDPVCEACGALLDGPAASCQTAEPLNREPPQPITSYPLPLTYPTAAFIVARGSGEP